MTEVYVNSLFALAPRIQFAWNGGKALDAAALTPQGTSEESHDEREWFDAAHHLAGVRHRYLNDATRYSLAAASRCLGHDSGANWYGAPEERRGIAVGTATADFGVRHAVDEQVMRAGPAEMNTVAAPNISANIAAAHVAIACRGRAFSTTTTSPFLAGFESLFLAVQSLQARRSDAVLAIATEEILPRHSAESELPGAVAVQLHTRGQPGARRILASSWAWQPVGQHEPGPATRRFLDIAAARAATATPGLHLAILRDASAGAETAALCWRDWLGRHAAPVTEQVFRGHGTLEPMLWAARWLGCEQPVVLVAIHQRRYLAFLLTH